jgi:hypothetical protein
METASDLAFADYELLSSYKWEVEKDSRGSDNYPLNITLNRRADARIQHHAMPCICTKKTDWARVIMHWERRSEDARNIIEDQNLDVQTKYTTVVSIIMEGVLDGTPKHKTRRNQGATNTHMEISRVLGRRVQPINQKKKNSTIEAKRISYMGKFSIVQERGG